MNSSNLVKVIAAFVGGIVVALGSALVYVRVHERSSQPALVQTAPPPSDTASLPDADHGAAQAAAPPEVAAPPEQDAPAAPTPKDTPPKPVAKRPVNTSLGHRYRHNNDPVPPAQDQQPVEVAQNTPPQPQSNPVSNPYTAAGSAPAPVPQGAFASQAAAPPPPPPAPVRQPRTITLPAGTALSIRLGEKLSTDQSSTGDAFRGTLEAPLVMNGAIIAERGSKVLGKVVNAEKAGRVKGVSDLQLALTEINTSDGQRVEIQTAALDKQGPTGKGKDAAKVGGGAALGAIIGAIAGGGRGAGIGAGVGGAAGAGDVLLTRGKAVVLPTETKLSFQLSAPVSITERLNY